MSIKRIKQEALDEDYGITVSCNGFEYNTNNKQLKKRIIKVIEDGLNLHRYAISTSSESGDHYLYIIQSKKKLNKDSKEIIKFLDNDCNDPSYEYIEEFEEIIESNFKII